MKIKKQPVSYEYKAEVLRVVDGDTFDLLVDVGFEIFTKMRIRLYGVNAPESRTRDKKEKMQGLAVKAWVNDKIEGETVRIKTEKKGKFGRYLAIVYYDDKVRSLNQEMVDTGRGKPYYGGKR